MKPSFLRVRGFFLLSLPRIGFFHLVFNRVGERIHSRHNLKMTTIEEAQRDIQTAKTQLSQQQLLAQQRLKQLQQLVPQQVTKQQLLEGGGIAGRLQRQRLETQRQQIGTQQQKVSQFQKQLQEQRQQVSQYEKQIQTVKRQQEEYNAAVSSIQRAEKKGMLWAIAAYGEGLEKQLASERLKQKAYSKSIQEALLKKYKRETGETPITTYDPIKGTYNVKGIESEYFQQSISLEDYNKKIAELNKRLETQTTTTTQPTIISDIRSQVKTLEIPINPKTGKPYSTISEAPSTFERYKTYIEDKPKIKGTLQFLGYEAGERFERSERQRVAQGGQYYQLQPTRKFVETATMTAPYFTPSGIGAGLFLLGGTEQLVTPTGRADIKRTEIALQEQGFNPLTSKTIAWGTPIAETGIGAIGLRGELGAIPKPQYSIFFKSVGVEGEATPSVLKIIKTQKFRIPKVYEARTYSASIPVETTGSTSSYATATLGTIKRIKTPFKSEPFGFGSTSLTIAERTPAFLETPKLITPTILTDVKTYSLLGTEAKKPLEVFIGKGWGVGEGETSYFFGELGKKGVYDTGVTGILRQVKKPKTEPSLIISFSGQKKTPFSKTFQEQTEQVVKQQAESQATRQAIELFEPTKAPSTTALVKSQYWGLGLYERTSSQVFTGKIQPTPTKQLTEFRQVQTPRLRLDLGQPTQQVQKTRLKTDILPLQEIKPLTKTFLRTIQREATITRQRQRQIPRQTTKTTTRTTPKPINPTTPFIPIVTTARQEIKELAKTLKGEEFEVFGKRFGKDISLGVFTTKKSAKKKLKEFLTGTLGASGQIFREGKPLSFEELGFTSQQFRPAKKDLYRIVQRASYRLGTFGEVAEIMKFKKSKNRKRNKKVRWF